MQNGIRAGHAFAYIRAANDASFPHEARWAPNRRRWGENAALGSQNPPTLLERMEAELMKLRDLQKRIAISLEDAFRGIKESRRKRLRERGKRKDE